MPRPTLADSEKKVISGQAFASAATDHGHDPETAAARQLI
jgi:hypothetical protein